MVFSGGGGFRGGVGEDGTGAVEAMCFRKALRDLEVGTFDESSGSGKLAGRSIVERVITEK